MEIQYYNSIIRTQASIDITFIFFIRWLALRAKSRNKNKQHVKHYILIILKEDSNLCSFNFLLMEIRSE